MKRMALTFGVMAVWVVVSAGVAVAAVKVGTNGPDEIFGTSGSDVLYGRGGADLIEDGSGGDDVLHGGNGWDSIFDGPGDDVLYGGKGGDFMHDGQGNNIFHGGGGDDFISSTATFSELPGSETAPRRKDVVSCGSGRDTAVVDPGHVDVVAPDCEEVLVATDL